MIRREAAIREVNPDTGEVKIHGHTEDPNIIATYRARHRSNQTIIWREVGDWNIYGPPGHDFEIETVKTSAGRRKIGNCSCGWSTGPCRTTANAEKHTRRHHPQAFCPTPNKIMHKSREAAAAALVEFWSTAGTGKKQIRRVYECECGAWHTTSRPGNDVVPAALTDSEAS